MGEETGMEMEQIDAGEVQEGQEVAEEPQSLDDAIGSAFDEIVGETEPSEQKGLPQDAQQATDAVQAKPVWEVQPPEAWDKDGKAAWEFFRNQAKAGDPNAQKAISEIFRRAEQLEEYGKRTGEEISQMRRVVEDATRFSEVMRPIGETIAGLKPLFQSILGADGQPVWSSPAGIANEIKAVMQMKHQFVTNPLQGMRSAMNWLRGHGHDMTAVLAELVQDAHGWESPDVALVKAESERNRQYAEAMRRQQLEQAQYAQQQAVVESIGNTVAQFSDAVDDAGNPYFPHLNGENGVDIGVMMGRYIRANAAAAGGLTPALFQQAYETAVLSHPKTRQSVLQQEYQTRLSESNQRARKGKQARGFVPSTSVPAASPGKKASSIDDAIEAAWASLQQ